MRPRAREYLLCLLADRLNTDVGGLRARRLECALPQVRGEVANPLEVGDDLERGGNKPAIARDRLLEREQTDILLLESEIQLVALVVALDDLDSEAPVSVCHRPLALSGPLSDYLAHAQHVAVEGFESLDTPLGPYQPFSCRL